MDQASLLHRFESLLSKYVPEGAAPILASWVLELNFDLHISHERQSKYGDYRFGPGDKRPRISVNHNLNPFSFLVTLVHEIAHLTSHKKHGNRIKPHGSEWKQEFRMCMRPFFIRKIFPPDLEQVLMEYLANPAASSCTDDQLYRSLKKYDKPSAAYVHIEDLPEGAHFLYAGNRVFIKGSKLRKRFRCREIKTGHDYLFSPVAEVLPINRPLKEGALTISELAEGTRFYDQSGKAYIKESVFGSGFQCREISSAKSYWFSPEAPVSLES